MRSYFVSTHFNLYLGALTHLVRFFSVQNIFSFQFTMEFWKYTVQLILPYNSAGRKSCHSETWVINTNSLHVYRLNI